MTKDRTENWDAEIDGLLAKMTLREKLAQLTQVPTFDGQGEDVEGKAAAVEAVADGVHWAFAPMVDVSRDPRWGRIAESFGEDPYLSGEMGAAVVRFELGPEAFGFYGPGGGWRVKPGLFKLAVGGNSLAPFTAEWRLG